MYIYTCLYLNANARYENKLIQPNVLILNPLIILLLPWEENMFYRNLYFFKSKMHFIHLYLLIWLFLSWKWKVKVKSLSCVRLYVTPWTAAFQAPPLMGFSRQEYWSGLPFPSPEDIPDPGIHPGLRHCRQTVYHQSHQRSPSFEFSSVQFSSVAQLYPTFWDPMDCSTPGLPVHQQLPEFTQTHVHWVSDAIQSSHSVIPFSSHLQSFPASGSFQMTQFFASCGQSIGVSDSTSVLPMNTQDWSSLWWTGWISLQSKRLSKVFANTTVQKHQFFSTQLSL